MATPQDALQAHAYNITKAVYSNDLESYWIERSGRYWRQFQTNGRALFWPVTVNMAECASVAATITVCACALVHFTAHTPRLDRPCRRHLVRTLLGSPLLWPLFTLTITDKPVLYVNTSANDLIKPLSSIENKKILFNKESKFLMEAELFVTGKELFISFTFVWVRIIKYDF